MKKSLAAAVLAALMAVPASAGTLGAVVTPVVTPPPPPPPGGLSALHVAGAVLGLVVIGALISSDNTTSTTN